MQIKQNQFYAAMYARTIYH